MGILATLQERIEALHDVAIDLDVTEYIVDDEVRREIPGAQEGLPEQFFVRESADGMEMALYIAPAIVTALEQDDPHARLHGGNLESYCIALEGVSHFVYVAWRATVGWPVTPLEMEIQAEVDKFVAAWMLLAQQGVRFENTASSLLKQLFNSYELRPEIVGEEADRYHIANRVARAFCMSLAQRYAQDDSPTRIIRDARAFHRQSLVEKMRAA